MTGPQLLDIDPAEIGKNVKAHVPICGDAKRVLSYLNAKLSDQYHKEWLDQINRWQIEFPRNQKEGSELLLPQYCNRGWSTSDVGGSGVPFQKT